MREASTYRRKHCRRQHSLQLAWLILSSEALLASACGGSDPHGGDSATCLAPLQLECQPAYEPPSFDAIYTNVLQPRCSSGTGSQCHGDQGRQKGLVLGNEDEAYQSLLGQLDGRARVIPGDPECSILIQRLESTDRSFRMPANSDPLDETVRCAIRQWVANGATRE